MDEFQKIVKTVAQTAEKDLKNNAEDYRKDGLLYCGKCNEPKQVRIVKDDGLELIYRCVCSCEEKERKEDLMKIYRQQQAEKIKACRLDAFSGSRLTNCTFATDDGSNPDLITTAKGYVDDYHNLRKKGKGLLFFGNCDTGKTFVAACILNALIEKGYTAKLLTFNEIENQYASCLTRLNCYDVICIDDFGSERDTSYMQELVFRVINERYDLGKPLIITSNLTSNDFKNPKNKAEKRIFDRLIEICFFKESKGENHRKRKMIEDYEKYKDVLNL